MVRHSALRLFLVTPDQVHEHPPGLPTRPDLIPPGPVEGYEAYCFQWDGDPARVFGPFRPVVKLDGPRPFIRAETGGFSGTEFWFRDYNWPPSSANTFRPCWFQSGATLRFIATRTEAPADARA